MYLIDMPPPTISGLLHMGHIFSYSHMDFMARYHEMKGEELVYPFGYDNNGLPTEKLGLEHYARIRPGERPDPLEITGHSHQIADMYRDLFKQMGMSYRKEYHTSSIYTSDICLQSFDDLKEKGLCYFGETEYWYCPKTKVSVSQSELTDDGLYERSGEKAILKKGTGWFIKIKERLDEIREAIDQIEWKPEKFKHRLHRWLDDLRFDWSISREREYGIGIPGEKGMVFDTWFISSLTPQLAWNTHTGECTLECPVFDARFQAHDIIRTWALFTIVKSLYHNNQIPWKTIVISGHALDKDGHKISKTAGNFVPPATYLDEYGPDAIRYWTAQNQLGTDTRTDTKIMANGQKLINKIKNARRFLAMKKGEGENKDWHDAWKSKEWGICQRMDSYAWAQGINYLQAFFWDKFCSEWIEQSKDSPGRETLEKIMDEMLPYFEIFMPNIRSLTD